MEHDCTFRESSNAITVLHIHSGGNSRGLLGAPELGWCWWM